MSEPEISFDSWQVVQMLRALEQQTLTTPERIKDIGVALIKGERAELLCCLVDGELLLGQIATLARQIETLIALDGLGASESIAELVFRTLRMVLFRELDTLAELLSDSQVKERTQAIFFGKFHTMRDVASYAHKVLDRPTNKWLREREVLPAGSMACRSLLRSAELAMRALGKSPDLLTLLDKGMACVQVPAVVTTCSCIQAALNVRIDVPTDLLPRNVMRLQKLMAAAREMIEMGAEVFLSSI